MMAGSLVKKWWVLCWYCFVMWGGIRVGSSTVKHQNANQMTVQVVFGGGKIRE